MADPVHADPSGDPPAGDDQILSVTPEQLSPKRIGRRLLQFMVVVAVIVIFIFTGPGLGELRSRLTHASLGWVLVGIGLEFLSALSYVVIFRSVFCRRMRWSLSYQFGMAEQGANSVLSVSGAGGLALGAWALKQGGMNTEHIGRRTVAFFFLTSLANFAAMVILGALFLIGVFHRDPQPVVTYVGAGLCVIVATAVAVGLPRIRRKKPPATPPTGKLGKGVEFARNSLGQGVVDSLRLLRTAPVGVLIGSFGAMIFDLAVLVVAFKAFHYSPPLGIVALAYLIGQLGGNLPIPGGFGGLDLGLIGVLVLYKQPLAVSTAAVLVYHAISLWVPAALGSVAFVRLRRVLQHEAQPAAICNPLADVPTVNVKVPTTAG